MNTRPCRAPYFEKSIYKTTLFDAANMVTVGKSSTITREGSTEVEQF